MNSIIISEQVSRYQIPASHKIGVGKRAQFTFFTYIHIFLHIYFWRLFDIIDPYTSH